ncbi:MAG: substrate-binding domain-containing protein, partial [Rhodospirillales bacterium]|nr:substrate-binding domain-containing protein [Rhodospirillales bacterium]
MFKTPSRRQVLKGAGALAVTGAIGAPFITKLKAAEPHPLAGQKIEMNILGIAGWLPSSLGVKMSPLFADYVKDRYGYDVSFGFAEAPFSDLFQKAATSLATRSQEYNIIISDSQWIGALAQPGWILQLNDLIAKNPELDIDWYSQVVVDTYMTYPDGTTNIWGLPQEGDTIALFVRKDMLQDENEKSAFQQKYGMKLPQTFEDFEDLTMEDFEKVAEFFTRPDQGLYGTAMQYSRVYDFVS